MKAYKKTHYIKYLTDDEFEKIKDYFNKIRSPSARMCFKMIMYLGLRRNEAIALRKSNFNADFSKLTYTLLKVRRIHEREIPSFLQHDLKEFYEKYQDRMQEGYLFFPFQNSTYKHLTDKSINAHFHRLRKKLPELAQVYYIQENGMPRHRISPHTLRHYACYKYFRASGNDIVFTQKTIGHKNMAITSHYVYSIAQKESEKGIVEKAFL